MPETKPPSTPAAFSATTNVPQPTLPRTVSSPNLGVPIPAPKGVPKHPARREEVDAVSAGGASNCVQLTAFLYEIDKHMDVVRVGGTSAGSLGSIGLAFGVPEDDVLALFIDKLADDRLLDKNPLNLMSMMGLCKGDKLREAIVEMVGTKTMGEAKIPLFCMVTDLYESRPRVVTSTKDKGALVCDVGVASAAVPGLFCMQEIRGLGMGNRRYCDGGVIKNFAVDVYDDVPDRPTIGVRVSQTVEVNPVRPGDHLAYGLALARALMWSSDNGHLSAKSDAVIVEVDAADGFDFSLSKAQVTQRWERGKKAAANFLSGRRAHI